MCRHLPNLLSEEISRCLQIHRHLIFRYSARPFDHHRLNISWYRYVGNNAGGVFVMPLTEPLLKSRIGTTMKPKTSPPLISWHYSAWKMLTPHTHIHWTMWRKEDRPYGPSGPHLHLHCTNPGISVPTWRFPLGAVAAALLAANWIN